MGEKRGNLEKLIYDFDTSNVCEVGTTTDDGIKWYRTTAKRFRSWDGPRRLTGPEKQPGHGIDAFRNIKMITTEYNGPLYLYETNIKQSKQGTEKYIETITEKDEALHVRRGNRL